MLDLMKKIDVKTGVSGTKSGAKVFFCIKWMTTLMLTARYVGKGYVSLLSGKCCCLNIAKLRCKKRNYRNGLIKRPLH